MVLLSVCVLIDSSGLVERETTRCLHLHLFLWQSLQPTLFVERMKSALFLALRMECNGTFCRLMHRIPLSSEGLRKKM